MVLGHVGPTVKKNLVSKRAGRNAQENYGLNEVKSDVTQPFNIKIKCRYFLKNVCKVI